MQCGMGHLTLGLTEIFGQCAGAAVSWQFEILKVYVCNLWLKGHSGLCHHGYLKVRPSTGNNSVQEGMHATKRSLPPCVLALRDMG